MTCVQVSPSLEDQISFMYEVLLSIPPSRYSLLLKTSMEQVGLRQAPLGAGSEGTIMLQLHLTESCGLPAEAATVQIC